jgi:hypothetical protein
MPINNRATLKDIADRYNQTGAYDPDPRMRALNAMAGNRAAPYPAPGTGTPDNSGYMTPGAAGPDQSVAGVPGYGMHDASTPEQGSGAGTMDQMMAERQARLQQNNLAAQQQQAPPEDMSGYQTYHPGQMNQVQPRQFPQIQQSLQAQPQSQLTQAQAGQEVTPQLEHELFPQAAANEDDEDEK